MNVTCYVLRLHPSAAKLQDDIDLVSRYRNRNLRDDITFSFFRSLLGRQITSTLKCQKIISTNRYKISLPLSLSSHREARKRLSRSRFASRRGEEIAEQRDVSANCRDKIPASPRPFSFRDIGGGRAEGNLAERRRRHDRCRAPCSCYSKVATCYRYEHTPLSRTKTFDESGSPALSDVIRGDAVVERVDTSLILGAPRFASA